MTSAPLVSIIIPSYNYGFVIAETIASLQRQTITDWEAIIVDDGSRDNTEEVVKPLAAQDARVTYIKQVNAGVSAARNQAIKLAKGKFIQFLDADDLLSPQKLEIHINYLLAHPEESIVFSNIRFFRHNTPDKLQYSMDGNGVAELDSSSLTASEAVERMFAHNIVAICAPLFRREVMDKVGLYDELLTSLEDWEYWFRAAIHGYGFAYLDDDRALALIRVHKISLSWNWDNMTANRSRLRDNMQGYITEFVADEAEKQRLLKKNQESAILYLGFSVFMNIKFYNIWWGVKKAVKWSYKFNKYRYFLMGSAHSMKVRIKTALAATKQEQPIG
jgi:glycosyltransferase involved in cell wall biosynthesis